MRFLVKGIFGGLVSTCALFIATQSFAAEYLETGKM